MTEFVYLKDGTHCFASFIFGRPVNRLALNLQYRILKGGKLTEAAAAEVEEGKQQQQFKSILATLERYELAGTLHCPGR